MEDWRPDRHGKTHRQSDRLEDRVLSGRAQTEREQTVKAQTDTVQPDSVPIDRVQTVRVQTDSGVDRFTRMNKHRKA